MGNIFSKLFLLTVTIIFISISMLTGCKFRNKTQLHTAANTINDDRIIGAWSINRYKTFPDKSFVIAKDDGQYYLIESQEIKLDNSSATVGQCCYKNLKKMKLKLWLYKINNQLYVELEDKTCDDKTKHSFVSYKLEVFNNKLIINSQDTGWINTVRQKDNEFKQYLIGKTFDDILDLPQDVAIRLLRKNGNEVFEKKAYVAIRLPSNPITIKDAAEQFSQMAPKLGRHLKEHQDEYKKINNVDSINEYACYGEAALLYKVAYLLGDDSSHELQLDALQVYLRKIAPFFKENKKLNLFQCESLISAYESYKRDQYNANVIIGTGIALGAIKKFYDWVNTPPAYSSSYSGNQSSGKRWVCKITCTGSGWATGPKGTLETFAPDWSTAQEQAAERGAKTFCSGSTGKGIYGKISTSGRPDVDCQEQF